KGWTGALSQSSSGVLDRCAARDVDAACAGYPATPDRRVDGACRLVLGRDGATAPGAACPIGTWHRARRGLMGDGREGHARTRASTTACPTRPPRSLAADPTGASRPDGRGAGVDQPADCRATFRERAH